MERRKTGRSRGNKKEGEDKTSNKNADLSSMDALAKAAALQAGSVSSERSNKDSTATDTAVAPTRKTRRASGRIKETVATASKVAVEAEETNNTSKSSGRNNKSNDKAKEVTGTNASNTSIVSATSSGNTAKLNMDPPVARPRVRVRVPVQKGSSSSSADNSSKGVAERGAEISASSSTSTSFTKGVDQKQLDSIIDDSDGRCSWVKNMSLHDLCDNKLIRRKDIEKVTLVDQASFTSSKKKKVNHDKKSSFAASLVTKGDPSAIDSQQNANDDVGPRVEIVNGKIVLKESSLIVGGVKDTQFFDGDYEEIEEGIHANSRYSSYLIKKKSTPWGVDETRLFYQALRQCGTEFSLMQSFFPNRTRKELKRKFYREEGSHPVLMKQTLENQLPLELVPFKLDD